MGNGELKNEKLIEMGKLKNFKFLYDDNPP